MNKITRPIPQGNYKPAIRHNDLIYTSGMTPRKAGFLVYSGQLLVDTPIGTCKDAVCLAVMNALGAAQACVQKGEKIAIILQLTVFLNTEKGFTKHAQVADFASDFLIKNLGPDCIGSRAAVGVASLPSNAPVEITIIAKVT